MDCTRCTAQSHEVPPTTNYLSERSSASMPRLTRCQINVHPVVFDNYSTTNYVQVVKDEAVPRDRGISRCSMHRCILLLLVWRNVPRLLSLMMFSSLQVLHCRQKHDSSVGRWSGQRCRSLHHKIVLPSSENWTTDTRFSDDTLQCLLISEKCLDLIVEIDEKSIRILLQVEEGYQGQRTLATR